MPKLSSIFVCQQCGFRSHQYLGKCPECDSWGSLVEEVEEITKNEGRAASKRDLPKIVSLSSLDKANYLRFSTKIGEFDRVLGGGIVPGSLILISGDPGIGKSTLLTQLALNCHPDPSAEREGSLSLSEKPASAGDSSVSPQNDKKIAPDFAVKDTCLYIAGEESAQQIKLRAERIKKDADLQILNEVDVDLICEVIKQLSATSRQSSDKTNSLKAESEAVLKSDGLKLVIIDSIQTMETQDLNSAPGTISQVRECALRLQNLAKSLHIPIFLVGHVTKDGTIAGPKTLEHLVDVVLALEGDPNTNFRVLKTYKNRFGSCEEVGIFEMEETGLKEIMNPSEVFLKEKTDFPGSALTATLTGQRTIMAEIQALTTRSFLPAPRRVGTGIDNQRLQLLVAVLTKRLKLPLFDQDIFVNVTGGLKILEPAADLGIVMAIISSLKEKKILDKTIFIGEVGLLGEIRSVRGMDRRIKEAKKLGFKKVISPENVKTLEEAVKIGLFAY